MEKSKVHPILYKPTELQKLAAKKPLLENAVSLHPSEIPSLPASENKPKTYITGTRAISPAHKIRARVKLQVLYDRIPPLAPERVPDCQACVSKACCKSFMVELTKDEYESGIYDYAVKFTKESIDQLKFNNMRKYSLMQAASIFSSGRDTQYFLEGSIGRACPYLDETGCTIYADRPMVCRSYTCKGDTRITDAIREGTDRVFGEHLHDTE